MLNKTSEVPLHVQLTDLLRRQIIHKDLHPNDRLPSERELCTHYGVSRITVRQSINTLIREGLVHTRVGKGTYVADLALHEELQPLSSFTQDMERRGLHASSQVLEASVQPADAYWSSRLRLPLASDLVYLHRLRLASSLDAGVKGLPPLAEPIAIQTSHLPHCFCPGLLNFDFSARSLYDVLRTEYGIQMACSDTVIEAALALPHEAELLQLASPAAVLISTQTTYQESGAVIEITRSVFNPQKYRLHMHL